MRSATARAVNKRSWSDVKKRNRSHSQTCKKRNRSHAQTHNKNTNIRHTTRQEQHLKRPHEEPNRIREAQAWRLLLLEL